MITKCPNCHKLISLDNYGNNICPKCHAAILIGNPLLDEQNRVIVANGKNNNGSNGKKNEESETEEDLKKREEYIKIKRIKQLLENHGLLKELTKNEQEQKEKQEGQAFQNSHEKTGGLKIVFKRVQGTPWDNLKRIGFIEAFFETTKAIVVSPQKFFIRMKSAEKPSFLPMYGVIAAFVGTLFQTFWALKLFKKFFPDFVTFKNAIASLNIPAASYLSDENRLHLLFNSMNPTFSTLIFQLILSPFVSIIFTAFVLELGSMILNSRVRLIEFYRMSSFLMVTKFLNIIPVLGFLISFVWQAVLVYKGGKIVNNFTPLKAKIFVCIYLFMQFLFIPLGGI